MTWKPDVTVAAVVEQDGRFLFVEERASGRLVLNQPAGHLEAGESLLQAVIRETLEESAWAFHPTALIGTYMWTQPDRQRGFLRFAFTGTLGRHYPDRKLDRGIYRTLWLTKAELQAQLHRARSPMVMRCVEDYVCGQRFPLEALKHLDVNPSALHLPSHSVVSREL